MDKSQEKRIESRKRTILNRLSIEMPIGTISNYLTCISEPFMMIRNGNFKNSAVAKFKCKCGNVIISTISRIKRGYPKSCGCVNKSCSRPVEKHGDSHKNNKNLYAIFNSMKQRCDTKNIDKFPSYAGKGIKICNEWQKYTKFREWSLSNNYQNGLSIDRIDPNKDYCPENCQWITKIDNSKRVVGARDEIILFQQNQIIELKKQVAQLLEQLANLNQ